MLVEVKLVNVTLGLLCTEFMGFGTCAEGALGSVLGVRLGFTGSLVLLARRFVGDGFRVSLDGVAE